MQEEKIGFIGLGAMGRPMAENLVRAGFAVTVFNRTREKTKELAQMGASVSSSPEELALGARVLIVMVSNSPDVEEVILGEEGAIHGLGAGSVVIDMGTSCPSSTLRISKILGQRGIEMLDAPVSGGVKGAEEATLTIMAGGKKEVFDRCKPILSAMGKNVLYLGQIGSGHITKAINNYLAAAAFAALAEALVMAKKAGLSPTQVLEVIQVSSGRSYATERAFPQFVLSRKFDAGFLLGLMKKDLGIFASLGEDYQTPMFLGHLVHQLWEVAAKEIGPSVDYSRFVEIYEAWAGAKIEG
ncbi:MAG: NAD(P)-dependent oxidoreductase, partial [candidate division NC10 bacterium]|nr:NAD(P)-dependent oxidoreductase [candidate division NC10 bacterium]